MNRYKDRVAIVTGGALGIGRALCEELAQRGAIVFVADIDPAGAQRVVSEVIAGSQRAQAVKVDMAQPEAVANLVASAVHQYGRLDYMFNNAGVALAGEVRDMEISDWEHALNVNLWGVIHGTSSAYKVMVRQGAGHIINTASGAGLCPAPMNAAYCTTKYAVVGFSTLVDSAGRFLDLQTIFFIGSSGLFLLVPIWLIWWAIDLWRRPPQIQSNRWSF